MKRFIQVVFLAGSLALPVWGNYAAAKENPPTKHEKRQSKKLKKSDLRERGITGPEELRKRKRPPVVPEEAGDDVLAETEAEGVGKCPHCGVATMDVEREEDTNPDQVAAQVQPSKSKKAREAAPEEGADAIR